MSGTLTFHHGDNRDVLRRMIDDGVRVQSVVTDPPYGLTSIVKRFGKDNAAPALPGTDGAFQRASGGFMGQQWDASGIERDPEFWQLIHDVLLPGGYVLAFSSPRTGHWMAVAMEMAGFVMHPFMGWTYGSGFPKAHDAAKAIDKELGQEGSVTATGATVRRMIPGAQQHATGDWTKVSDREFQPGDYEPGSAAGAEWQGWKYGGQSMKPALEPIYIGQRPFDQKNGALNILTHGVGALNIDGCRVAATGERLGGGAEAGTTAEQKGNDGWTRPWMDDAETRDAHAARVRQNVLKATSLGRHPANLLHDGSDAVRDMFPNAPGQLAASSSSSDSRKNQNCYGDMRRGAAGSEMEPRQDADTSAARFFNCFPPDGGPLFYNAKAGKADRAGSKHPTVKPVALMRWLCRLVTPPGGTVLDPFAGSGSTGAAAMAEGFDCTLIEANDLYAADIRRRFALPGADAVDVNALLGLTDPIMELIG